MADEPRASEKNAGLTADDLKDLGELAELFRVNDSGESTKDTETPEDPAIGTGENGTNTTEVQIAYDDPPTAGNSITVSASDGTTVTPLTDPVDPPTGKTDPPVDRAAESPTTAEKILAGIKRLLNLTNDQPAPYASSIDEAKQRSSQENKEMADTQNKTTNANDAAAANAARNARIEKLVACEGAGYTADDAAWMVTLPDAAFDRLEAVTLANAAKYVPTPDEAEADAPGKKVKSASEAAAVETKTVETPAPAKFEVKRAAAAETETQTEARPLARELTAEEFMRSAPPALQRTFAKAIEREQADRKAFIATIRANERNTFAEAYLETRETDELEALASLAAPAAKKQPSFLGAGMHTVERTAALRTNESNAPKMPQMSLVIGGEAGKQGSKVA